MKQQTFEGENGPCSLLETISAAAQLAPGSGWAERESDHAVQKIWAGFILVPRPCLKGC